MFPVELSHHPEETTYQPCGAVADPKKEKSMGDMCDSRYGGRVPGADVLASNHALAVVSKTARISAILKKNDPQVKYRANAPATESFSLTV